MKKIRTPARGEVWAHIDQLDRDDEKVWALQWRGAKGGLFYQTAHKIEWLGLPYMTTKFFGRRSKIQPRAVVVIPHASVEMIQLAPNMRVARIVIASPTTSSGVDRRRPARV